MLALVVLFFAADPAQLSFPIVDLPDQHGEYAAPTWEQSIEVTKAQYQLSHRVMADWAEKRWGPEKRDRAALFMGLGWEVVAGVLPLGAGWAHEEGHRAILDRRGIDSFNGVYDMDPFRGAIYVRRVRDEDLVWLKANHPADSARLAAAGMETQTALNLRIERDLFFLGGRIATDWPTLVSNTVNNIGYLWACSDPVFDRATEETNEHDGAVVNRRDALGLDCTAWAYDLMRPDEPYGARGVHPSGVGIDRYLTFSDLSRREQQLLRTVRWIALLQLADPFLFFQDGWRGMTTNASFYLTSFGWSLDHNVFVERGERNVIVTMRHQVNGVRWMPGLDVTAWRVPAGRATVTLGGGMWLQPEEQRWDAARLEPGARAHLAVAVPVWRSLEVEVAAAHKTAGWVPAVASLEDESTLRVGLSWQMQ